MLNNSEDPIYGGSGGGGGGGSGGGSAGGGTDTGITGGTDPGVYPTFCPIGNGWWEFFNGAWHWMIDPVPRTMLQP